MSFSNTFAFAVARAADVATASVFTKYKDCTVSSECDVALEKGAPEFLIRLGHLLNWISPGHTRAARLGDLANLAATAEFLKLPQQK